MPWSDVLIVIVVTDLFVCSTASQSPFHVAKDDP